MRKGVLVLLIVIGLFMGIGVEAKIKLPAIVSSNMVLQRNTHVKLWGWAEPGEKINITTSWQKSSIKVVTPATGKWEVTVQTTLNKAPQSIRLRSKSSDITLDNILFGEVWLCSGQSNMQQPLRGYLGQPTFGGNRAVAKSASSQLRLFTVNRQGAVIPQDTLIEYRGWQEASPASVKDLVP